MIRFIIHSFIILIFFQSMGCASFGKKLKAFLAGNSQAQQIAKNESVKFSESPNVYNGSRRQYKRTTRESLENESALEPNAGSLWIMEGQGSYLFAQNRMRMVGDAIGITIDGEPKEQLQSKVDVIKKLWSKFEERQNRMRNLAAEENAAKDKTKPKDPKEKTEPEKSVQANTETKTDFNLKSVPAKVVERTVDGNYRVKGSQPFMIGSREYKVIVTGVVRSEDFNDEGIPAQKLIDAKYDIVSVKRKDQEI